MTIPSTTDSATPQATRLAGVIYLLTIAAANFGDLYVRRRLLIANEPMQTLTNFSVLGSVVQAGMVSDLITIAANIVLVAALWVILKPVT